MREIKFRAWDKRQKQMSGIFTIVDITQYEHIFERMFNHLARFKDLIWLEYTGLLDKNGVEIYEGDIVRVRWIPEPLVVEFSFSNGWIAIDPICHGIAGLCVPDAVEVIGNIYENPELIGEKNANKE